MLPVIARRDPERGRFPDRGRLPALGRLLGQRKVLELGRLLGPHMTRNSAFFTPGAMLGVTYVYTAIRSCTRIALATLQISLLDVAQQYFRTNGRSPCSWSHAFHLHPSTRSLVGSLMPTGHLCGNASLNSE